MSRFTEYRVQKDIDDWLADAPMPEDEILTEEQELEKEKHQNREAFLSQYGLQFYQLQHASENNTPGPIDPEDPELESNYLEIREKLEEEKVNFNGFSKNKKPYIPQALGFSTKEKPVFVQSEKNLDHTDSATLVPESVLPASTSHWGTFYYYEFDNRVGKSFEARDPDFVVNGIAEMAAPNRMSLMGLYGDWKANTIKKQIAQGILISRKNGLITLRCLTACPVFLQCPQISKIRGELPYTVYRLQKKEHDADHLIFDEAYFEKEIEKRKNMIDNDFYLLHTDCIVRVGFVKGFGSDYPKKEITETPCWIEIHMIQQLALFDKILRRAHAAEQMDTF